VLTCRQILLAAHALYHPLATSAKEEGGHWDAVDERCLVHEIVDVEKGTIVESQQES
jgi:hypothetical protein